MIDIDNKEEWAEGWKAFAEGAKKEGALIYGQISHPGRQAPVNIQENPLSPSDVQNPFR